MYDGAIIVESLKIGASLDNIPLVVRKLTRQTIPDATDEQPSAWTILEFQVEDRHCNALAEALKALLDEPAWYADFHNDNEIFVVFPGRVFRYQRGDMASRAEAQAHGRMLGIPESQLDWPD
jgi:hypothetical protein